LIDLEKISKEYMNSLLKIRDQAPKDPQFDEMVNFWTLFDALYLSHTKSQMIRKVLQTLQANQSMHERQMLYV
jgi:hypothetical protein